MPCPRVVPRLARPGERLLPLFPASPLAKLVLEPLHLLPEVPDDLPQFGDLALEVPGMAGEVLVATFGVAAAQVLLDLLGVSEQLAGLVGEAGGLEVLGGLPEVMDPAFGVLALVSTPVVIVDFLEVATDLVGPSLVAPLHRLGQGGLEFLRTMAARLFLEAAAVGVREILHVLPDLVYLRLVAFLVGSLQGDLELVHFLPDGVFPTLFVVRDCRGEGDDSGQGNRRGGDSVKEVSGGVVSLVDHVDSIRSRLPGNRSLNPAA